MSCIERCPHFRGKCISRKHIKFEKYLIQRYPYFRDVLLRGFHYTCTCICQQAFIQDFIIFLAGDGKAVTCGTSRASYI